MVQSTIPDAGRPAMPPAPPHREPASGQPRPRGCCAWNAPIGLTYNLLRRSLRLDPMGTDQLAPCSTATLAPAPRTPASPPSPPSTVQTKNQSPLSFDGRLCRISCTTSPISAPKKLPTVSRKPLSVQSQLQRPCFANRCSSLLSQAQAGKSAATNVTRSS